MSIRLPAGWRAFNSYLPLLAYFLSAGAIALAGYQGFHRIETLIETEKLNDLGDIADMKVEQIVSWQEGHIRRVGAFSRGSLLAGEFERWLVTGKRGDGQEHKLLLALAGFQHAHGYSSASLLDTQGVVRITTAETDPLAGLGAKLVRQAISARQPFFSDIHTGASGHDDAVLSLVAPLMDASAEETHITGAILLQVDPKEFLYPLIQLWPKVSASAETLLTRQEGNEIVFINELRHREGAALSLRIPLSTPDLPSAMVLQGVSSTMSGIDYRGVPVVAAMRRVPGTSWYMTSKVDRDELFAPVNQLKRWSAGLGLAFVVLGGFFFHAWLQGVHARQKLLGAEHDAALEREMRTRHFEHLTRYANDMILVSDESGRFVEANQRAVEAYGYTREELMQMHVTDVRQRNGDPGAFKSQVSQLMAQGELRFEDVNRRKDGTLFPVEVSARLIDVGGIKYLQAIVRDMTEHKQLEEMRGRMERVARLNVAGEMASGLAHELSQPLTACSNYLDVCLRGMAGNDWDHERLQRFVLLASKQAERAGRILSHLRGQMRTKEALRERVDVNQLVREVMSLIESEIRRQGISVVLNLKPVPPVMACGIEIEQVIFNLCRNAIEAMVSWPQRELRVATRQLESGDVCVSVSDTGKGIMPDEQEYLFNPFYTTKQDGLGLGLVICRSFVENHGGRIWADARREMGAEFSFTLPASICPLNRDEVPV